MTQGQAEDEFHIREAFRQPPTRGQMSARLIDSERVGIAVEVVDLSRTGALLRLPHPYRVLPAGTPLQIVLTNTQEQGEEVRLVCLVVDRITPTRHAAVTFRLDLLHRLDRTTDDRLGEWVATWQRLALRDGTRRPVGHVEDRH